MPLTSQQRQQAETRIRAADQLLRGDLPPAADVTSRPLRPSPGSPAPPSPAPTPLKDDFGQRLARARAAGQVTDPRDAQVTRLKQEIGQLRQRLAGRDAVITELTEFKTRALSQLAARHDELQQTQAARPGNLCVLPARSAGPHAPGASHAAT